METSLQKFLCSVLTKVYAYKIKKVCFNQSDLSPECSEEKKNCIDCHRDCKRDFVLVGAYFLVACAGAMTYSARK